MKDQSDQKLHFDSFNVLIKRNKPSNIDFFNSLVFARQAFGFHGMPGKFILKQIVSAYAIFKQYLDSLIPAL